MSWVFPTLANDSDSAAPSDSQATSIHFPPTVAAPIVSALNDSFRFNVEVCGVLLGTYVEKALVIAVHLPATSFALPERPDGVKTLLDEASNEPSLAAYKPVGWYLSRTSGELLPSASEIEFFKQFFPEMWQVILVLQPNNFGAARAQFFSPGSSDSVPRPISGEFLIQRPPYSGSRAISQPKEPAEPSQEWGIQSWAFIGLCGVISIGFWLWAAAPRPAKAPGHPTVAPVAPGQQRARTFSVSLYDNHGQLNVNWDHSAMLLLNVTGGLLRIESASFSKRITLTDIDLLQGSVILAHGHFQGAIKVSLEVFQADGRSAVENASVVGMPFADGLNPSSSPVDILSRAYRELENSVIEGRTLETDFQSVQPPPSHQLPSPEQIQSVKARLRPFVAPVRLEASSVVFPAIQPPPVNVTINLPAVPLIPDPVAPQPLPQQPKAPLIVPDQRTIRMKSGTIVWSGNLSRRGVLEIERDRASAGYLNRALPGVPISVEALPGEFTPDGLLARTADPQDTGAALEAASPENGWNAIRYTYDPKSARDISVLEPPTAQTGWLRLTLRSESRDHSVIILRWHLL
jgi:hypothetical protein